MSPLSRQSTIFLQSKLTEELNSESSWIDGAVNSAFNEDSFFLFEGAATPLDGPPVLSTDHLLPSFDDDHLGPPSASSGGAERVNFVGVTSDPCTMPFGIQPDDLFDHTYQVIYSELIHDDYEPCVPAQTMTTSEIPPVPCDDSVAAITQTLSATHFPLTPVDPSTMMACAPYSDHGCDPSQILSTPDDLNVASPPPTSPTASSPCCDSSESDGGDTDYVPSDDDRDYHPTQSTSPQKQKNRKVTSKSKAHRRANFSPARSITSESEKNITPSRADRRSHPYRRHIPSRNFQSEDSARLIDSESNFCCPVVGCEYFQRNQRIPDLKRHIITHDRWMEPEKWTCCGVVMNRAHLYDIGIEEGMTEEDHIKAGAYMFRGQLMIGGCLNTFARRDALKRHVDNPNIPCVGQMGSYF